MKAGDDKNRRPSDPNLFTQLASQSDQVNNQIHALNNKKKKKDNDSFRGISNTIHQPKITSFNPSTDFKQQNLRYCIQTPFCILIQKSSTKNQINLNLEAITL